MKLKKLLMLLTITCLTASTAFAATEFGVDDDLTVEGTTGDFNDADVEIAGFTTLGSTIGATLHLGIKVGSIWAAGGIEASSYSCFGSSVNVVSSITVGALVVSGWANFASTVTIGERHLIIEGGSPTQVLYYDAAGAYWATAGGTIGGSGTQYRIPFFDLVSGTRLGDSVLLQDNDADMLTVKASSLTVEGGLYADGGILVLGSSITIIGNVADAYSLGVTTAADQSVYHLFVSTRGNVGIGTTDPASKLTVLDGDIRISTTTGSRGIIFQDGTTQITAGGTVIMTYRLMGVIISKTNIDGGMVVPFNGTIVSVSLYRETAGTSASTIVDIHKSGTTIFTTQANRPAIAYDAGKKVTVSNMDVTSVSAGDILTCDIDQVDGGNPEDVIAVVELQKN